MTIPELTFTDEDLAELEEAIKGKLEVTMASQKPIRRKELSVVEGDAPNLGNEELKLDLEN
jgi:hypothetical protein